MYIYIYYWLHTDCYNGSGVPGLRPAVNLTSLAILSSCDCTVRLMQYISLLSAGGWWLSCTEILGTLEMILQTKKTS